MRLLSFTIEECVVDWGTKLRAARLAFRRYGEACAASEPARELGRAWQTATREAEMAGEKLRTLLESDA